MEDLTGISLIASFLCYLACGRVTTHEWWTGTSPRPTNRLLLDLLGGTHHQELATHCSWCALVPHIGLHHSLPEVTQLTWPGEQPQQLPACVPRPVWRGWAGHTVHFRWTRTCRSAAEFLSWCRLFWTAAPRLHRRNQQEVITTLRLRRISLKCSGQKLWTITSAGSGRCSQDQQLHTPHASLAPGGPRQPRPGAVGLTNLVGRRPSSEPGSRKNRKEPQVSLIPDSSTLEQQVEVWAWACASPAQPGSPQLQNERSSQQRTSPFLCSH